MIQEEHEKTKRIANDQFYWRGSRIYMTINTPQKGKLVLVAVVGAVISIFLFNYFSRSYGPSDLSDINHINRIYVERKNLTVVDIPKKHWAEILDSVTQTDEERDIENVKFDQELYCTLVISSDTPPDYSLLFLKRWWDDTVYVEFKRESYVYDAFLGSHIAKVLNKILAPADEPIDDNKPILLDFCRF